MIAIKPNNDAGRALTFIARCPARPVDVADHLWPYPGRPPQPIPPGLPRRERDWRLPLYQTDCLAHEHLTADHRLDTVPRAVELLQRLARARLVEPRGDIQIAGWVVRSLCRYEAAAERMVLDPARINLVDPDAWDLLACRAIGIDAWDVTPGRNAWDAPRAAYEAPEPTALARVMREVRKCPTLTVRERSGGWRATLARAIRLGLIDEPSAKAATEAGHALVSSWSQPIQES